MFSVPITETLVLAIDEDGENDWVFHYIDLNTGSHDSFSTPHGGEIMSVTVNPQSFAAWILASGQLYAASRELRVAVPLPLPVDGLVPFDITLVGDRYYLCGANSNVWYYDVQGEKWVPVVVPHPREKLPEREAGESAAVYVNRTHNIYADYARSNPDMYKAFSVAADCYFVGALGRTVRLRGDTSDEVRIDSGVRLLHGYAEEDKAVLCGSGPIAAIYKGDMEAGFEQIFQHDEKAYFLSALYDNKRFIGAGMEAEYEGEEFLFTLEEEELVPVVTGCAREPEHLLHLMVIGSVLWAIDLDGIFRYAKEKWTLTELSDLA